MKQLASGASSARSEDTAPQHAQRRFGPRIGNALALTVKAPRHPAEPGLLERNLRRRLDTEQGGRERCHILGRCRLVITQMEYAVQMRPPDQRVEAAGNIIRMNP